MSQLTAHFRSDPAADEFLKAHRMHPDQYDPEALALSFQEEMQQTLAGNPSSLAMLPTYLETEGAIPEDEPVLVLDAGGTNLRIAALLYHQGEWKLLRSEEHPMPGSLAPLSREEYLAEMAALVAPFTEGIRRVGYCFSYSAEILPNRDGRLDCFNKGVTIRDSEGMLVCRELKDALAERGAAVPASWVLLNDSVAATFGGSSYGRKEGREPVIGLVLGTGTNSCYSEDVGRIRHHDMNGFSGRMLINTESGGYAGFPRGDFDLALHETDPQPNVHCYEKMVSGVYLGKLLLLILKGAASERLLSPGACEKIAGLSGVTAKDISFFLDHPLEEGFLASLSCREEDRAILLALTGQLIERAARLITANLLALLRQAALDTPKPALPLLVAEGSTFWKLTGLTGAVRSNLICLSGKDMLPPVICSIPQANLIGAATAALLNSGE